MELNYIFFKKNNLFQSIKNVFQSEAHLFGESDRSTKLFSSHKPVHKAERHGVLSSDALQCAVWFSDYSPAKIALSLFHE